MDSDLALVNGKSGRQSWRYHADAFQRSIISEAIYHVLLIHQFKNRTTWRVGWMTRLLLFDLHTGSFHTYVLAFLVEKFHEVTPTGLKALICWISQILMFTLHV